MGTARAAAGRRQALAYGLALAVIVLVVVAVHVRWVLTYRDGQLLDIDEAGYLRISLGHYYALVDHGLRHWLDAAWGSVGPVAPLAASLVFLVTAPVPINGFLVPILAAAGAVVATYWLGAAIRSRWAGLLAAVLVATAPVLVDFARSFHLAAPATLTATLALLALVKSDRFSRTWASLAFGVLVATMPLARTMALAFVPGLFVAATLVAVVAGDDVGRRLRRVGAAFLVTVVVLLAWLIVTRWTPIAYLLDYGYGRQAAEYGAEASLFSVDSWLTTLRGLAHQLLAPHFLVALAGVGALGLAAIVMAIRHGARAAVRRAVAAGEMPLLVFLAAGGAALASSGNEGSAFEAPLVPALMVLAMAALLRWRNRIVAGVVGVGVAVAAVTAFLPKIDVGEPAEATSWNLPVVGWTRLTDSLGTIQRYELSQGGEGAAIVTPAEAAAWWEATDAVGALIMAHQRQLPPKATFAVRHHLVNVNSVGLRLLLENRRETLLMEVEPLRLDPTVDSYAAWLNAGDEGQACVLITMDSNRGEFRPAPDPAAMAAAAVAAGFRPEGEVALPRGQVMTVWRRVSAACPPEGR